MEEKGGVNAFANDGSFMEMFRKKMEEEQLRSVSTKEGSRSAVGGTRTGILPPAQPTDCGSGSDDGTRTGVPESVNSNPESAGFTETSDVAANRLSTSTESTALHVHLRRKESEKEVTVTKNEVTDDQSAGGVGKTAGASAPTQKKYSLLSHVGKRRDGKLSLKTGTVKKQRNAEHQDSKNQDSWSKYMAEVQKYKAHVCGDEDKSRPLVK